MRRSLAANNWRANPFKFGAALVKGMSPAFASAALRHDASATINQALAEQQHAAYVATLRSHIPSVVELPADADAPDCCFIEDTAVAVGDVALVTRPGAASRLGEADSTAAALESLGLRVIRMAHPGRLDGGDVLFTGREFFVGLSARSNRAGVAALSAAFPGIPVTPVPMLEILGGRRRGRPHGSSASSLLHLKSACSMLLEGVVAVADTPAGAALSEWMGSASRLRRGPYELAWLPLPEASAANAVALGDTVLARTAAECPESLAALRSVLTPAVQVVEVRRGAPGGCSRPRPRPLSHAPAASRAG